MSTFSIGLFVSWAFNIAFAAVQFLERGESSGAKYSAVSGKKVPTLLCFQKL